MNFTRFTLAGQSLASLSIGCMRWPSREAAAEVINTCAPHGVTYLDTSPAYCFQTPEENTECWVGAAIAGQRERFVVSAKCAVGGGSNDIGEYNPERGFSITTADQVRGMIDQSMRRLGVDHLDCYQLWAVHAPALFDAAHRPGGWLEGVLAARDEGLISHIGITGHADGDEIRRWVDSGWVEIITVPFNIMNTGRLEAMQYAMDNDIAVIAMNPLAGGFLGAASGPLAEKMADMGVSSAADLALRYVASLGISALGGMTSAFEAEMNTTTLSQPLWSPEEALALGARFTQLIESAPHFCTGCAYCMPCTEDLDIPGILRLRNYHKTFDLESARREYRDRSRRDERFQADRCTACGTCEGLCPNSLPVATLMAEVMREMA